MNYFQVIRVIVFETVNVSDSEVHKLKDENKLPAGKIHLLNPNQANCMRMKAYIYPDNIEEKNGVKLPFWFSQKLYISRLYYHNITLT